MSKLIELYDGFLVLYALPKRISDLHRADELRIFSMEHML